MINDPACGPGGFFIASLSYVSNHYQLDVEQKHFLKYGMFSERQRERDFGRSLLWDEPLPALHRRGSHPY